LGLEQVSAQLPLKIREGQLHMRIAKYILIVATAALLSYVALAQTNTADKPAVVSAVAPTYPMSIKTRGRSGDSYVDVEIDRNGKVTSADAASAPELFREVIVEAARRWQFAPNPNGQQRRKVRLTFTFRNVPPNTSSFDSTPIFYPPYRIEVRNPIEIFRTEF
jgi:TonB family protein